MSIEISEELEDKQAFPMVGISSKVIDKNDNCIGHVLMLDIEDASMEEVVDYSRSYLTYPIIFKSSERNWHIIDATMHEINEVLEVMKMCDLQDEKHTEATRRNHRSVLRVGPKPLKERPELKGIIHTHVNDPVFSKPHLEYIKQVYGSHEADFLLKVFKNMGSDLNAHKYWTWK